MTNEELAAKFEKVTTMDGVGLNFTNEECLRAAAALRAAGAFADEHEEETKAGNERGA